MAARKTYNLSIVIPTYKEEHHIERCINESLTFFRNSQRINTFEIIFAADDAGDRTIPIIKQHLAHNPELRLIVNETRLQKGFSVRRGVLAAKHALIMFYDCDLSTPLSEVNAFLDNIDQYDMLIASRGLKDSRVEKRWHNSFFSKGFAFWNWLFLGTRFKDTQCGFKMFKSTCKALFEKQTIKTSTFDVEILYLAKKKKFTVKELPVTWVDSDTSNFTTLGDITQCVRDTFAVLSANWKGKYD